jgi:outer membrane receptor protein involved in Fe transport
MPRILTLNRIALAASLAALQIGAVKAQPVEAPQADAAQPAPTGPLNLDAVVVTGASTRTSKMKQSNSVSSLSADQITRSAPTSAAEVLRAIPGIRAESSGGEGNANLTVRGAPISAGGSRYVQFQEDGLPVLMFGDIAFGTADQFVRVDYNLDRLEVVRGGSASTMATNSPGGLINFISKTGQEDGGNIGITAGVGNRLTRYDMDYGGKIGEKTRVHIGGFYRTGDGGRSAGFNAEQGGQIKGNITHELDNGYVRLNFKSLDDRTPTFLPVPVVTTNGRINTIPGIDPRTAFFISPSLSRDVTLGRDGNNVVSDARDGLHVTSNSIGAEAVLRLGDGWTVEERFRTGKNSGRFIGLFPSDNGNNGTSSTFTGVLFNTSIDKLNNTVNDLKLTKQIALGGGKATLLGGLFQSSQDVALTWFWNSYTVQMNGSSPSASLAGTGYTTFGGCCARSFDVQYTTTAPYAGITWEGGPLTVDASVRRDSQRANGWSIEDKATNGSGAAVVTGWDASTQKTVNYRVSHNSYSVGANYSLSRDLAVFARTSDGVAYAADRLLYGKPLDGSVPIDFNELKQTEAGVKWRAGALSTFATLFNARTKESNYEATTQQFTSNRYSANGLELEAGWRQDGFRVLGGATFTRAKITGAIDSTTVGKKPRRQAEYLYQVQPSYTWDKLELGGAVIGTGASWGDDANTIRLPAYAVVNLFAGYQLTRDAQVQFSVNNALNKIGYTEVEGDGHAARSINGRTARVSLKYAF